MQFNDFNSQRKQIMPQPMNIYGQNVSRQGNKGILYHQAKQSLEARIGYVAPRK